MDYARLYSDHDRQRNHWWWRPGWRMGTRFLAFHITLEGQDELHALADSYAAQLQEFSSLDPIPRQWRHITLQGLGHVENISDAAVDDVLGQVADHLSDVPPIVSRFQRAAIFREAIALPPDNPAAFAQLRNAVRAGILDSIGEVTEAEDNFRAHVSIAYSNRTADAQPIRKALDSAATTEAAARFDSIDLIEMHRDHQMYQWRVLRRLWLGHTDS